MYIIESIRVSSIITRIGVDIMIELLTLILSLYRFYVLYDRFITIVRNNRDSLIEDISQYIEDIKFSKLEVILNIIAVAIIFIL